MCRRRLSPKGKCLGAPIALVAVSADAERIRRVLSVAVMQSTPGSRWPSELTGELHAFGVSAKFLYAFGG